MVRPSWPSSPWLGPVEKGNPQGEPGFNFNVFMAFISPCVPLLALTARKKRRSTSNPGQPRAGRIITVILGMGSLSFKVQATLCSQQPKISNLGLGANRMGSRLLDN